MASQKKRAFSLYYHEEQLRRVALRPTPRTQQHVIKQTVRQQPRSQSGHPTAASEICPC